MSDFAYVLMNNAENFLPRVKHKSVSERCDMVCNFFKAHKCDISPFEIYKIFGFKSFKIFKTAFLIQCEILCIKNFNSGILEIIQKSKMSQPTPKELKDENRIFAKLPASAKKIGDNFPERNDDTTHQDSTSNEQFESLHIVRK